MLHSNCEVQKELRQSAQRHGADINIMRGLQGAAMGLQRSMDSLGGRLDGIDLVAGPPGRDGRDDRNSFFSRRRRNSVSQLRSFHSLILATLRSTGVAVEVGVEVAVDAAAHEARREQEARHRREQQRLGREHRLE